MYLLDFHNISKNTVYILVSFWDFRYSFGSSNVFYFSTGLLKDGQVQSYLANLIKQ